MQFFAVNQQELDWIEEKMSQLKTKNKGAYYRKMAVDGYIINVDYSYLKAHTSQIQRLGQNINQILKRMNTSGSIYQEDAQELKELMNQVWQLQRSILSKAP